MICTLLPIFASAQEPYAIMIDGNTAIEFRYDNEKTARGGMDIGPFDSGSDRPWSTYAEGIYSVIFDESFANCTSITSTAFWFSEFMHLEYIGGLEYLNTSNVTDMEEMFFGCKELQELNVSNFRTGSVTNMSSMFNTCTALRNIDVTNFNTSSVTNMSSMFFYCFGLEELDLTSFQTRNVTDMTMMFGFCPALTTIYVNEENWNTVYVSASNDMFQECQKLVGGMGTAWSSDHIGLDYAHIDFGPDNPGYLTARNGGGSGEEAQYWMELRSMLEYAQDVQSRAQGHPNVEPWMQEELAMMIERGSNMYDEHTADEEEVHHMIEEINWICWEIEEAMNRQPEPSEGEFGSRSLMLWRQVGGKEYRLYKAIDSNQYLTNADGWNMYLTTLSLDIVNGADTTRVTVDDGTLYTSGNIYDNGFFPCMMIDVANNQIHIFSNSKDGNGSYTMAGHYFTASLDALSFSKEIVYDGANWGWWPQFAGVENGQPVLRHFSYAGYYSLVSRRTDGGSWSIEDGGDIQPDSYNSMWRDINKVTVVGNTYHDEEVINGVTYTLRNNTDVYISWISNRYDVTEFSIPETVTIGGTTMNVTGIAPYTFYECGQMKNLEIPASVYYIGDASVMHCGVLESVTSYSTIPSWYTYPVFPDQAYQDATLYVPRGSKASYQSAEGWSNFQKIEEMDGQQGASEEDWRALEEAIYYAMMVADRANGNSCVEPSAVEELKVMADYARYIYDEHTASSEEVHNMAMDLMMRADMVESMICDDEGEARFDGLTAWVSGNKVLDDAFVEVGGREVAAQTIAAIVWNGNDPLTADMLSGITNPNLLVYVNEASKAPAGVQNVVVNGTASQIVLTDASGNNNFYCPQTFTAQSIYYTRNFSQTTEIGVSRGWETIALPFNVQSIVHESHGALIPFGGGNGGYPIWLHQLRDNGLTPVTAIEANTPYLICMPNNRVYPSAYNQAGNVTFASSNVTVPETNPHEAFGGGVMLVPAFQGMDSNSDIFTLNVGEASGSYAEGSVFISNYRSVRPFQAYARHTSQARGEDDDRYIPLTSIGGGDDDTTGIMEVIQPAVNGTEAWYSLDGRRFNAKPTKKGVYIQNGKKIVIK